MKPSTLDTWIWVLVYGGLLLLCLGLFVQRAHDPLGWTLVVVGGVTAAAGALGIWVRSKMKETS